MGTAPRTRQHPAMPDPRKVVTRSFRLLKRIGMSDALALLTIFEVATAIRRNMDIERVGNRDWVSEVALCAQIRLAALGSKTTDREGNDHADR